MTLAALAAVLALTVVDGDTVKTDGERMRLVDIDAAEIGGRADCWVESTLAALARARLSEIVAEGVVVEDTGERDFYGRPLIYLRTASGLSVGDILVAEGLAVPWEGRRHDWCEEATPDQP